LVLSAGAEGLRFAASSAALGSGCPRGGSPGRVRTHEQLHHDEHGIVVPHGRMAAWNSKEARTRARPGCSPLPGSIRSARVASVHAAPTRSLAARTAGSTRRSYRAPRPTLAHKINCVRSLPPPGREQQERAMQHADGASRASMLRCRGWGHMLAFGDQSATLAPIAMSPAPRSSADGCWESRIACTSTSLVGVFRSRRRSWLDLSPDRRPKAARVRQSCGPDCCSGRGTRPEADWANPDQAIWVERNYGPTTDHHSRTQRTSTVNHGHQRQYFTPEICGGPIWGSRGREFKSRQPDKSMSDYHTWSERLHAAARSSSTSLSAGKLGPDYAHQREYAAPESSTAW
jgi:hypothetical protein